MLYHYFLLSLCVFSIGLLGMLWHRKNIIRVLLSIEMMLLAVNINFVVSSVVLNDITGWIFMLVVLTLGASELAIGLSILIIYYRNFGKLDSNYMNNLKG